MVKYNASPVRLPGLLYVVRGDDYGGLVALVLQRGRHLDQMVPNGGTEKGVDTDLKIIFIFCSVL